MFVSGDSEKLLRIEMKWFVILWALINAVNSDGRWKSADHVFFHFDTSCLAQRQRRLSRSPPSTLRRLAIEAIQQDEDLRTALFKTPSSFPREGLTSVLSDVLTAASSVLDQKFRSNGTDIRRLRSSPVLPAVSFEYLPAVEILIVHNPHLDLDEIVSLSRRVPCVSLGPTLEVHRPVSESVPLSVGPSVRNLQDFTSDPHPVFTGHRRSLEAQQFLHTEGAHLAADSLTHNASSMEGQQQEPMRFQLPTDPLLNRQWYLFGPSQNIQYGIDLIDTWALVALSRRRTIIHTYNHIQTYCTNTKIGRCHQIHNRNKNMFIEIHTRTNTEMLVA